MGKKKGEPIHIAASIHEKTKNKKKGFFPVFYKYGTQDAMPCPYVGDKTWPTLTEAKQWLVDNYNQIEAQMNWSIRFFPYLANMPLRTFQDRYKGLEPKDVWNAWSPGQRMHFMTDHDHGGTKSDLMDLVQESNKGYDDINLFWREQLREHINGGQYGMGGKVKPGAEDEEDEAEDLFAHYDELPTEVQELIDEYNGRWENEDPYHLGNEMEARFAELGYEFDFGLDGEASNLRKIKAAKGGRIIDMHYEKGGVVAGDMEFLKGVNVSSISNPLLASRIPDYVQRYGSLAPSKLLGVERSNISMLATLVRAELETIVPSRADYIDALEAAKTMLEFAENDTQRQEYEDYIAGLEAMIEMTEQQPESAAVSVPESSEVWYIEFLNKEKNFRPDRKEFSSFEEGEKWGRDNLENFNLDMLRLDTSQSGEQKKNLTTDTESPVLTDTEKEALLDVMKQAHIKVLEETAGELARLKDERDSIEKKRIEIRDTSDITLKSELANKSRRLASTILYQENRVAVLSIGSTLVSFTDKKGTDHQQLPFFVPIPSTFISFDEDTILNESKPGYIPLIDEEEFRRKGYVFDAIRVGVDEYVLAINGFSEDVKHESGLIMVTLDQLVLINDYYLTKSKAKLRAESEEKNKRQVEWYFKLPEERRRKHFDSSVPYRTLPAATKKKISEAEWNGLSFEEKEQLYQPVKRYGVKRISSKLEDRQMWQSFHRMYERFVNPDAKPAKGKEMLKWAEQGWYRLEEIEAFIKRNPLAESGHPEVFAFWYKFRDMLNWKIKDIQVQRTELSEFRKVAMETSFGDSGTSDILLQQYGIKIKRQNGDQISPSETDQIARAWSNIEKVFGVMKREALAVNLKISHTGARHVFASRAIGMFVPQMHTIAVSAKYGDEQFQSTFAHEVAHWIDYSIGKLEGKRHLSDNYESIAGRIAMLFRESMNKKAESDYLNATEECFARAMQQYFSMEIYGEDATFLFSHTPYETDQKFITADQFVGVQKWTAVKELIVEFLSQYKTFFG